MQQDDDIFEKVTNVIETVGKKNVRFIPFDQVWYRFFGGVKKHFFIFEGRKTAIVYFYNDET